MVTDSLGRSVETVYDERGLVAQTADASNRVTAYSYDAAGRQLETTVTLPGGSPVTVESRTYTCGGRLRTRTSGSGAGAVTTWFDYDAAGRRVASIVDPGTISVSGCVSTLTPGGLHLTTTTGYDAAGRPTSVTSPGGITSTTTYAFGTEQRTETTFTPGRGYTRTVFSERDEAVSTQRTGVGGDPASPYSTVGFVYDDRGNLSAVTDANGNTVTYTFDGRGNRLTRTSTPDEDEVVETWAYNAADELVAETDGLDRETTYEYNAAGQVASVMDPSARETVFEYCEAGDADCAAGAVRRVTYHVWADTTPEPEEEPVATEVVAFGYDPSGRRTEAVVDPGGADDATVYTYTHVSGQVTGVDGPGSSDYTIGYDTAGRRVSLTGPDGVVVAYGYDDVGRLETVDRRPGTEGEATTYTYDADGRLTGQALPEGQYRHWTYDPASGLLDNYDQLVDGSRRTTNVAHDSLGRRWIDWTDGTVTTFGYDKADQLTGVHRSDSVFDTAVTGDDVSYLYDGVGNRTARIQGPPGDDDGDPEATDGTVEFYEYDDANQLTYVWSTVKDNLRFTYDPAGRRTAMGVDNDSPAGIDPGADRTDNTYGPAGRLTEVTTVEGDHTWVDTRGYDADGNLIGGNGGESAPGDRRGFPPVVVADHTFGYVWDTALAVPQPLQSTTDAPGVTATAVYTNGLGLVGGGTDRVGAEVTLATSPDPTVLPFTLATDVNGSTIPTPNTAGFARAHGYDEYGNPTGPTMGNPHEPALGYRGELQTADTVHLRARTYHPHTGTFTTPDPLDGVNGTTTAANPYHYANNTPAEAIDPTGLRSRDADLCDQFWAVQSYVWGVQMAGSVNCEGSFDGEEPATLWDAPRYGPITGEQVACALLLGPLECSRLDSLGKYVRGHAAALYAGRAQLNERGESNAFVHAYLNALMTVQYGATDAAILANNHEFYARSTTPQDFRMDMHNNREGRKLGERWRRPGATAYTSLVRAGLTAEVMDYAAGPKACTLAEPWIREC